MIHLITGGISSGKSQFAENIAKQHCGQIFYVATAEVLDDEFKKKVKLHQARRPVSWGFCESDRRLANTLVSIAAENRMILVDCLSMWLMRFFSGDGAFNQSSFLEEKDLLLKVLSSPLSGDMLLVTNEVGLGGISEYETVRRFALELGNLSQDIASISNQVTLVACGLPLSLKHP